MAKRKKDKKQSRELGASRAIEKQRRVRRDQPTDLSVEESNEQESTRTVNNFFAIVNIGHFKIGLKEAAIGIAILIVFWKLFLS